MHQCDAITLNDIHRLPVKTVNSVVLPCSADIVWQILEDADSWPRWVLPMRSARWTSPQPYGVGTTREVDILGLGSANEEFLVWETNKRMAFRFNHASNKLIRALGEDYVLEPLQNGHTKLSWTLAMDLKYSGLRSLVKAGLPINENVINRFFFPALKRLCRSWEHTQQAS